MGDFQIPKLKLEKPNSGISESSSWTSWLETLFTLCDSLDRLCHAIDPQYPIHELENLDFSNAADPIRMNSNVLKQTADRDSVSSNSLGVDDKRSETDPTESRFLRGSNMPNISQVPNISHKPSYPCNVHYNSVIPQLQIGGDVSRRGVANYNGYTYSPISNANGSNEQYCYNDTFNLDYQYQLYLDAWAQSVQPTQNMQSINQDSHQYDCKELYPNYQYSGPERYPQSPMVNKVNYDSSTTPTTSTPNYSPTYNTRRRKDDLSVPRATNEFDYLLSMPSQRIPVNSKDDMKCEIAGVYWDKRSWIASWYEDGKRYYKSFSARTHGFYRSKYFAIQIRLGKVRQNIIKQQRPRARRVNKG